MKIYVITTGAVFGLLTVTHIWRAFAEGHLATDSSFVLITVVAAALCVWAGGLIWRSSRS